MLSLTIQQIQGGAKGALKTVEVYSHYVPRVGEYVKADDRRGTVLHGDVIAVVHDFAASPRAVIVALVTLP